MCVCKLKVPFMITNNLSTPEPSQNGTNFQILTINVVLRPSRIIRKPQCIKRLKSIYLTIFYIFSNYI